MERAIVGFHCGEAEDWVAEFSCGHDQDVRHRPPIQNHEWVLDEEGRASHVGTSLDCPLCDRAELPVGLRVADSTPEWDERTMPSCLLHSPGLASGMWALVVVRDGQLRFGAATEPRIDVAVGPDRVQAIPPDVAYELSQLGPVHFSLDYLVVAKVGEVANTSPTKGARSPQRETPEIGGDPVCWAHLLCPECGVVLGDGAHRAVCQWNSGEP